MDNNVKTEKHNYQKNKRTVLTVAAYLVLILVLLTVAPVLCPRIINYTTHNVSIDHTKLIWQPYSVIYSRDIDATKYEEADIVAIKDESSDKQVIVEYVSSNNISEETLSLDSGATVSYDNIVGRVKAKTPYIGFLTRLCNSLFGIVIVVVAFIVGIGLMMYLNKLGREMNELEEQDKKREEKSQAAKVYKNIG